MEGLGESYPNDNCFTLLIDLYGLECNFSRGKHMSRKRRKLYKVYCITDITNGKQYVGMTAKTLPVRLHQHSFLGSNSPLATHILAKGAECFGIELVDVVSGKKNALAAESEYILALGTLAPAGYNRRVQGQKRPGQGGGKHGNENALKCNVLQVTKDGCVVRIYPSIKQAAEATGINRTGINSAAIGKRPSAGGFYWIKTERGN